MEDIYSSIHITVSSTEEFKGMMGMWITGSSWSEAAHKISRTITTFGSPRYPKEVKGWDFSPCVPKKSQVWEASAAGSQFCDLSIWLPGAIASLCFPLAAVFPGARLGWDPVQEISQCNLPLTAPQHSRSESLWDCQYLPGFFIYSLKTSVWKSIQSEEQEDKSGSCVSEETNPRGLHLQCLPLA